MSKGDILLFGWWWLFKGMLRPVKRPWKVSVLWKLCFKPAKQSLYFIAVERTEQCSPRRAKKKKVTFGEDLSPEIFDKTLPANTPLRKGSTPVCRSGSARGSPCTRAGLTEEPLTQPNFDCSDVSFRFLYRCTNSFSQLFKGSTYCLFFLYLTGMYWASSGGTEGLCCFRKALTCWKYKR